MTISWQVSCWLWFEHGHFTLTVSWTRMFRIGCKLDTPSICPTCVQHGHGAISGVSMLDIWDERLSRIVPNNYSNIFLHGFMVLRWYFTFNKLLCFIVSSTAGWLHALPFCFKIGSEYPCFRSLLKSKLMGTGDA